MTPFSLLNPVPFSECRDTARNATSEIKLALFREKIMINGNAIEFEMPHDLSKTCSKCRCVQKWARALLEDAI